jgi:sulfate/thiosulfate transport system substrate-binding protein
MHITRAALIRWLGPSVPLGLLAALVGWSLWPWLPIPGRGAPPRTIVFYGFSILVEAMDDRVIPAFERDWARRTGERVEVISSYAGSGTVVNQLTMGAPADVALLSLELDAMRLADAGVIAPGSWRRLPHGGVVNYTPFVLLVRPGNPLGIYDFADAARPGVGVVHPDPLTSGGANWAIVAEYGAGARARPGEDGAGEALLTGIWRNVVAQAASARAARTQFENGFGDVLITYEQELLVDRARGRLRGEIVYPHHTIRSEHPLVVIDRNVSPDERELVDAFVDFLWSEEAQRLFVASRFRSVDEQIDAEGAGGTPIDDLFSIADLGGWAVAKRDIVDGIWRDRVLRRLRP